MRRAGAAACPGYIDTIAPSAFDLFKLIQIVVRFVRTIAQNRKNAARGNKPLGGKNSRFDVQRLPRRQLETTSGLAIEDVDRNVSGHADRELLATRMGMPAADASRGYIDNPEHPPDFEGHGPGKLDRHQKPAEVAELRQVDNGELIDCRFHSYAGFILFRRTNGCCR